MESRRASIGRMRKLCCNAPRNVIQTQRDYGSSNSSSSRGGGRACGDDGSKQGGGVVWVAQMKR